MKFILKICLLIILGGAMQWFLPWWTLAGAALLVGLVLAGKPFGDFLTGFLGGALLWLGYSIFLSLETNSELADRIAQLFFLPGTGLLLLVPALVGGLTAGMGMLTGSLLFQIYKKPKTNNPYRL